MEITLQRRIAKAVLSLYRMHHEFNRIQLWEIRRQRLQRRTMMRAHFAQIVHIMDSRVVAHDNITVVQRRGKVLVNKVAERLSGRVPLRHHARIRDETIPVTRCNESVIVVPTATESRSS